MPRLSAALEVDAPARSSPPLSMADALGIFLLVAAMLSSGYLRGRHRIFWSDEIMGAFTLRQTSWPALLHAWRTGLDSSGIWFYVLARPWIAIFGFSEMSLRMFSATGIAASAGVLWIAARRFFPLLPVAATISYVYFGTAVLRWQLSNGRTYGIFMLAVAVVLSMLLRGEDAQHRRPSATFLAATCAAYIFLMGSHILGLLYCVAFAAMQVALDARARRWRPSLYVAMFPALAVFAFSRANIAATSALGKPTFWSERPTLVQVLTMHNILYNRVRLPVIAAVLLLVFLRGNKLRGDRRRQPLLVVLASFVALNFVFFAVSRATTSIYTDRYMMPFALAVVLLLCEAVARLTQALAARPLVARAVPAALLALGLAFAFIPRLQPPWMPFPDYTTPLLAALPQHEPVIITDTGTFVEAAYYHPELPNLSTPIDWPVVLAHNVSASGTHEMENFHTLGIFAEDIHPTAELLATTHDFAVVTDRDAYWVSDRLLHDPRFAVTLLGSFNRFSDLKRLKLWQVHPLAAAGASQQVQNP